MEKRFFVLKENIKNNNILLENDEHNHLSKVLRLKVGDTVECFFDDSDIYICKIAQISKNNSILEILETKPCLTNPDVFIALFQGLPKTDKLELIAQKLCEIGVSKITPFSSDFCVAKANSNKTERLNKICISACKQCGRTKILEVEKTLKFSELLNCLKDFDLVIFANETEKSQSLKHIFDTFKKPQSEKINPSKPQSEKAKLPKSQSEKIKLAYIVGSEGGFSNEEINALKNLSNVRSVSLGKRILRTETAGIVLGALLCHYLGEI